MPPERTIFYIDAFNLYFGLKESGWKSFYWLNLQELANQLLAPYQVLVKVRYFTSRLTGPDRGKQIRQKTYLEALETLPLVKIHYGHYMAHPWTCKTCNKSFTRYDEKKSDVNFAVSLITDAIDDLYDAAILICGDSDLVPAVEAIKTHFPQKRVILFFPPKRHSDSLRNACHKFIGTIYKATFKKSQFPDTVTSLTGHPLKRPPRWT
jgi:uncharacterized LabA/DUF88 family protein